MPKKDENNTQQGGTTPPENESQENKIVKNPPENKPKKKYQVVKTDFLFKGKIIQEGKILELSDEEFQGEKAKGVLVEAKL